jgi:hypothetical protein
LKNLNTGEVVWMKCFKEWMIDLEEKGRLFYRWEDRRTKLAVRELRAAAEGLDGRNPIIERLALVACCR